MQTQNPTPKDKRVLKAHRKRYVEDKSLDTIAQELGKSYDTIRDYFRDESTERIKQLYDDEQIEFLRLQLLNMADNAQQNSKSHLSRALSHERASASDFIRASKREQEIPMKYIEMLQEIGILEKPKERKEVQKTETDDTREKLAEYYEQKKEEENNDEQD